MSDLDLVRDLFPERAPDAAARERVRAAVAAGTFERRAPLLRRRLVPAFGGAALAAAAALAVVFLFTGTSATVSAAAARVLRQAAAAARQNRSLATLGPDQFLYTRSTWASVDSYAYTNPAKTFTAFVPYKRESWLNRDGTGWLYQTSGDAVFMSDRDRQGWIAAGRPSIGNQVMDVELKNSDGPTPPMASLDLPSDPDALYAHFRKGLSGSSVYTEMFTLVGDSLRESYTTPAQRAALLEVAARLPGIKLVGATTDGAGRPAIGVAMDDEVRHSTSMLLLDPVTHELLGEEERVLEGNSFGYPAGTVIDRATYLEQKVVDSVPASVVKGASKG